MDFGYHLNQTGGSLLMGFAATALWLWGPATWDATARRRLGTRGDRLLEVGFAPASIRDAMRLWGVLLMVTPMVLGPWLGMPPLAVLATAGVFVAPPLIAAWVIGRRETLLRDQLVTATTSMCGALNAGEELREGLAGAAETVGAPLGGFLGRIVHMQDGNTQLPDAIDPIARRLKIEPFQLFANALKVAHEQGGRLNHALERLGKTLAENQRVERKLQADTASGRYAALLMGSFPAAFLGLFYLFDPEATSAVFDSFAGQATLSVAGLLTYAGGRWAAKILEVDI